MKIKNGQRNILKEHAHILPDIVSAMRSMFDPKYQVELLMNNRALRWTFFELIVAIEIIKICQGKRTSSEFIKAFKLCIPEGRVTMKVYLRHLATLRYLDKKNKLFRAVIKNPKFPDLTSKEIIHLTKHAISNERYASEARLDSDGVKIKGAVKNAKIIPLERKAMSDSGSEYVVEEAFESEKEIYQRIFQKELIENLLKEVKQYVETENRKDRTKHTLMYIDHLLKSKEENPSVTKVAKDLKLSRKTIYQIKKPLQDDPRFRRLIDAFLKQ
jgi:DNA-binding phage protein